MSEWQVQVVRVGEVAKHPNADTLSITHVHGEGGYPVIIRTGEFQPGDLAVYVPVDSLVPAGPEGDARWAFLAGHSRIKAKRLRGIFSMGLLTRADDGMREGEIVADALGITKYEPPESLTMGGENERCPFFFPVYTDIEGLRKWSGVSGVLAEGEEVVLTEKIHGANARFVFHEGRLWVGSHTKVKRADAQNLWWKAAARYDLARVLAQAPGIALYGEVYGQVQDLKYGVPPAQGIALAFFDALDLRTGRYLDYEDFVALIIRLGLPAVPTLYRGPWSEALRTYAEGESVIAKHVREGFVVRPVRERFHDTLGRVILKLVGEGYHLRKGG